MRNFMIIAASCCVLSSCTNEQIEAFTDAIQGCQDDLNIHFETDSSDIPEEDAQKIAECIADRFGHDDRINIEGHADERGSREYNLALADRRAMATKKLLEEKGYTNVTTISFGKEKPTCTQSHVDCWKLNRRVVISPPEKQIRSLNYECSSLGNWFTWHSHYCNGINRHQSRCKKMEVVTVKTT